MKYLHALKERRLALKNQADSIYAAVEAESRELSAEERTRLAELKQQLTTVAADIEAFETYRETTRVDPAVTARWEPAQPDDAMATAVQERAAAVPRFGSLGEQLIAVARSAQGYGTDPRLIQVGAATGLNEATPADGGFLVQQDFSRTILQRIYEQGQLLSRVGQLPLSPTANGITIPAVDETSRANGSRQGGVRAYWAAEADTVPATRPKFRRIALALHKLMAIVYATDELLADASALEAWLMANVPLEMLFVAEDAILRGDGVGKPLGILNSAALVAQTKESGQAADTVNATNIAKMFSRVPARNRLNAIWTVNQDVEPQFPLMSIANQPVYLPPGGFSVAPYGTLLGRPIVPTEYNPTVGDLGDLLLADLSQYAWITRGGVQSASSMHVRFINDEMTFRFTYRCDGQPTWNSALTPFQGSNTLSPFVALEART